MSRIKKYRLIAGMTQKDLAKEVGVYHSAVSAWELGQKEPRPAKKALICKALNISFAILFPGLQVHKATHIGEIHLSDKSIDCAVLEDGSRIVTTTTVFEAFGRQQRGPRKSSSTNLIETPEFMDAKNLQPFIQNGLKQLINPVEFVDLNGRYSMGYKADILPAVCELYMAARDAGVLTHNQMPIAHASEVLMRGFAKLGIIALVDEATGYQKDRDRKALQTILEKFIAKELQPWVKTFSDEYYEEIFRLKDWDLSSIKSKPSVIGHYTNDLIYSRLAPGVLNELKKQNPKNNKGRRKNYHHQFLTPDTGHPKLREHIQSVVVLMRASQSWGQLKELIDRSLPVHENRQLKLDLGLDDID